MVGCFLCFVICTVTSSSCCRAAFIDTDRLCDEGFVCELFFFMFWISMDFACITKVNEPKKFQMWIGFDHSTHMAVHVKCVEMTDDKLGRSVFLVSIYVVVGRNEAVAPPFSRHCLLLLGSKYNSTTEGQTVSINLKRLDNFRLEIIEWSRFARTFCRAIFSVQMIYEQLHRHRHFDYSSFNSMFVHSHYIVIIVSLNWRLCLMNLSENTLLALLPLPLLFLRRLSITLISIVLVKLII